MTDLVERAREYVRNLGGDPQDYLVWQLADEIERLLALLHRRTEALHNIAIGGNGEHNWTLDEMRAVAWDELKFLPPD